MAVVLDKNQIPEFDITRAVAVDLADMTPLLLHVAGFRPAIEMNLATRPARSCLAHLPEILFFTEAFDPLRWQATDLSPELFGLIIVEIHGRPQLIFWQSPYLSQKLPSQLNGFGFVVVAKRPVAEHLKKSMVVGIPTNRF